MKDLRKIGAVYAWAMVGTIGGILVCYLVASEASRRVYYGQGGAWFDTLCIISVPTIVALVYWAVMKAIHVSSIGDSINEVE